MTININSIMPWDEDDGFYSDNQILINYNGEYFNIYSHESLLHPISFSTIEDLLDYLKDDLEEFKDWYDYRMENENRLCRVGLSSPEIEKLVDNKKAIYDKYHGEIGKKATYHGKETKEFLEWKESRQGKTKLKSKPEEKVEKIITEFESLEELEFSYLAIEKDSIERANELIDKEDKNEIIKNIIIVGDTGIGKTTLVVSYLLDKFSPNTKMTNGVDFFLKEIKIKNLEFGLLIWDMLGLERVRFLSEFFAKKIDAAILCFDLTRFRTLENMEEWINIMRESNSYLPILFLGTKLDLVDEIQVDDDYALSFKDQFDLFDYIKVSSKTGENIQETFNIIFDKLIQIDQLDKIDDKLIKKKFKLFELLKNININDFSKKEIEFYAGTGAYEEILKEGISPFTLTSNAGNPDINGIFTLYWTSSVYANNYSLYQNETLLDSEINSLSYYIDDYSNGSYTFKVIAFNDIGNITSNEITINVEIPPIPNFIDTDEDGLSDDDEINIYLTNPNNPDTDNDGMPDGWEVFYNLNPLFDDSNGDLDYDDLSNLHEYSNGTNPNDSDSDDDGLSDGDEINIYLTDPNDPDTDDDGVSDGEEIEGGFDPKNPYSNAFMQTFIAFIGVVIILSISMVIFFISYYIYHSSYSFRRIKTKIYVKLKRSKKSKPENIDIIRGIEKTNTIAKKPKNVKPKRGEKPKPGSIKLIRGIEKTESIANTPKNVKPKRSKKHKTGNLVVKRGLDFLGGMIRYKVAIKNKSKTIISNIDISLQMTARHVRIIDIKPRVYKKFDRALIPNISPKQSLSIDFFLEPMICGNIPVIPLVTYLNAYSKPQISSGAPIEVISKCPLIMNPGEENIAKITNLFENGDFIIAKRTFELDYDPIKLFDLVQEAIGIWAGRQVSKPSYESTEPFIAEVYYYNLNQNIDPDLGHQEQIIIKVRVDEIMNVTTLNVGAEKNETVNGVLTNIWQLTNEKYGNVFGKSLESLHCPFCGTSVECLELDQDQVLCSNCGEKCRKKELRRF